MKLTKYGIREWLGGGVIALVIGFGSLLFALNGNPVVGWSLLGLTLITWLALAAFFRVPCRTIPQGNDLIVSPADGVVKDINVVKDHGIALFEGQPLTCIGIFLSVLDVHVNRAPCAMTVEYRRYTEGCFHDARDARCAKENESLIIAGTARVSDETMPVAIRQISGAIARRIVCDPVPGTLLVKGEIYGMIKFGSRTELYLPVEDRIKLATQVGDKVRSGTTVMAQLIN